MFMKKVYNGCVYEHKFLVMDTLKIEPLGSTNVIHIKDCTLAKNNSIVTSIQHYVHSQLGIFFKHFEAHTGKIMLTRPSSPVEHVNSQG